MLLSLNWLRQFVPYTGTAQELGDRLTMLGLELEEISRPFDAIKEIVIGRVLTCDGHPDSDHLHICSVDIGASEPVSIVCGATNVAAGQLVPVAPVGSTMPGGLQIKQAKLRGVPSFGMICSERELGLSDDHCGIMVLPENDRHGNAFQVGAFFVDAMEVDQEVLDISITPNRADCLSVLGLARMVSAAYDLPLTMPNCNIKEEGADCSKEISIEVRDADFCPAYTGRVIENCRVEKSPYWIRYRLHAIGIRPISNIVDMTNYILMELGQPLHSFDADTLKGNKIIIDRAKDGQKFVTLDGQERSLQANDGIICDAENAIALAGVMGGLNTQIKDLTDTKDSQEAKPDAKSDATVPANLEPTNVFLECAIFQPASVRRTARRLALNSDSSYRFERGVDQEGMDFARDRAAYLIQYYSGGTIRTGVCRHVPKPFEPAKISFHPSRPQEVIGVEISKAFCEKVLLGLDCKIEKKNENEWTVFAPGRRYDLTREADLVEEIAIFHGVDNMPATLPRLSHTLDDCARPENRHSFIMRAKHFMAGLGLNEAINYSFVGTKDLDTLNLPKEDRVHIINPLTADQDVLRTHLAAGILQNIRHNIAHGANGLRLFEIAHTFHKDAASETSVKERLHLVLALYGNRYDSAWAHGEEEVDYTDLRGQVDHFFANFLHLDAPILSKLDDHPYLAPAVELSTQDGTVIGVMGRVQKNIADEYYAKKAIWLADISLDTAEELARGKTPLFSTLPVYPAVRRDITIICPASMQVSEVEKAIVNAKGNLFKYVELRDVYVPSDSDERNLTFRLTFQSAEKTLEDKDVDKEREKIASSIVKELGVKI